MIRPILFNTEMVRAILEGRKTVTRRLITPQPSHQLEIKRADMKWGHISEMHTWTPPAYVGDLLWVRETWNGVKTGNPKIGYQTAYLYKADDKSENPDDRWRPSIHMPKEAARIFLRVKSVTCESLQHIDGAEAEAEGALIINNPLIREDKATYDKIGRESFARLWNSTLPPGEVDLVGWKQNPWVFVIKFERVDKPAKWEDYIK